MIMRSLPEGRARAREEGTCLPRENLPEGRAPKNLRFTAQARAGSKATDARSGTTGRPVVDPRSAVVETKSVEESHVGRQRLRVAVVAADDCSATTRIPQ